jgi:DNA repair photolyase
MVNEVQAKTILNRHKKRDDWFLDDYSVNPYQGCSYNCIYCYTRGSKYSTHMAKTLTVKINAPRLLEKQLFPRARKKEYGFIAFASQEPYLPIETRYKVTRKMLQIVAKFRFPVLILTKSTLVPRDLDILKEIDENAILPNDLKDKLKHGAIISCSISTLNEKLAKILEPGAPKPLERLETMKECKDHGFMVGVNFIPVLPFISDTEEQLDMMIKAAKDHCADYVFVGGLTLFGKGPDDCKTLYYKFLEEHFPELIPKYRSLFRIYNSPPWSYQEELEAISKPLCKKYEINYGIIPKD